MNEPACKFCRTGEASYYMTCPGCQARRQKALEAFQLAKKGQPLPPASRPS